MNRTVMRLKQWCTLRYIIWTIQLFTYAAVAQMSSQQQQQNLLQGGIRLSAEPSDVAVALGSRVVLPCSASVASAAVPVRLTWRYSAHTDPGPDHIMALPVDTDIGSGTVDERRQHSNGSLVVEKMSPSLAGRYQCVASVEGIGTVLSRVATLQIAEVPELGTGPRSVLVLEGSALLLPCSPLPKGRLSYRVLSATSGADRRVYGHHHRIPTAVPILYLNVTWLKDGLPVRVGSARASLTPSGALELDPAKAHDAGHYRCNVSLLHSPLTPNKLSDVVEVRVSSDVNVDTPPRFIATPRPLTLMEGSSATFDCAAVGSPRPEITWLNNGTAIDLSDLDSRFYLVGAGSLRVQSVRALDAGPYTCRAHNRVDSADYPTNLVVLTPPRVSVPGSKGSSGGSVAVEARARGDVTLGCEVKGQPPPKVTWLKDGETLTPNHHDIAIVNEHSLRIQGVLNGDAGMFQCAANSPAGNSQASLRLLVLPPDDDIKKSFLDEKPQKRFKSKSKSSKVRDGDLIKSLNRKSLLNSLISSSGVSDSISPSRRASVDYSDLMGETSSAYTWSPNSYNDYDDDVLMHANKGMDEMGKNTSILSAPRDLTAVLVKHRFVTLSWLEPELGSDDVLAYAVIYRVKGSERERVIRSSRASREMNVASLQPNTTYQFRVVAYTLNQVSLPTAEVEVQTPAEEWSWGPPRDIRIETLSPTAIRISWTPPLPDKVDPSRAAPQKYQIHYTEVESGREQYSWSVVGANTYLLDGLRASTSYMVRVSGDGGAPSDEVQVRTPGDTPAASPNNITATPLSATSILVRWEAPPGRTHRGALTGYKVRYRVQPQQGQVQPANSQRRRAESLTTPADARRAELKGLERATSYQVRVCALNANGSGPFSEWVSATTAHQELDESHVPYQPPPLRTRSGRDWISVWWSEQQGEIGSVRVRGYSISWGLGIPDEHVHTLPADARSHVIRDLMPNSEYVISLRASNALGVGPPVYATVITRNDDEESDLDEDEEEGEDGNGDDELEGDDDEEDMPPLIPPVGLKVIMLSGTTAVVYWTDPTLLKGQPATDGRRYIVRWSPADVDTSNSGKVKTFNATDLNCMIDELKPYTMYEFSVKLIKGGRESAWSMLVSNRTLEAPPASAPRDVTVSPATPTSRAAQVQWTPPLKPNGLITGYVIMYSAESRRTVNGGNGEREWTASAVVGDRPWASVDRLRPRTTYLFKVQARNSRGLGPFSQPVQYTTTEDTGDVSGGGGLGSSGIGGAAGAWLWASAGGACAVLALAAALALSLCCRRPTPQLSPDRSTYQKSSASTGIKPPDLWIHHDQMELKHMDKSHHSSSISAGSADNPNALVSSTLTLGRVPPVEYEPARGPHLHPQSHGHTHSLPPGSVDRRHYVPTYVEWRVSPAASCDGSDDTALMRASPASASTAPTYICHCSTMSSVGCAATCDRRAPHQRSNLSHIDQSTPLLAAVAPAQPLASPQSSLGSLAHLHPPPAPCGSGACPLGPACTAGALSVLSNSAIAGGSLSGGSDLYAVAARERGQYVAYEPLGHYTHRDSLSSDVGAASAASGGGSLQRRAPVTAGSNPLHSFTISSEPANSEHSTPTHGKVSCVGGGVASASPSLMVGARETSPYKKSTNSSPAHLPSNNRLQLGSNVPHTGEELEPLTPSRSTERLHREMANLEGLMKDLSAITKQQFHC